VIETPEALAVAGHGADLVAGLGRDDDSDLVDAAAASASMP